MADIIFHSVNIADTISNANAVTHSGVFHGDEVMATAILALKNDITVLRTFKIHDDIPDCCIVYDIGQGKFDHHQKGGNGVREDGIPYAACGLILREYGIKILEKICPEEKEKAFKMLDDELIKGIDAVDNGVPEYSVIKGIQSISKIISGFNPTWNSNENPDSSFLKAVSIAEVVLKNTLNSIISRIKAESIVQNALCNIDEHIIVLPFFVPWTDTLLDIDIDEKVWYVIYPSNREGYCCQCVPQKENRFSQRHPVPESWRGLSDEELECACGIKGAKFCHSSGFLTVCSAEDIAIKLAKKASEI